ncbi:hypothetical protein CATRI_00105 [Corynebacterium atrinae]|uniref:hypothetical protein n=1 Tax=Corynebacterium atrinae TaxID=1336740 RepID=UPI0025B560C6|nr:hypothetical protein [Corynebacterium atrinae]WJY62144.1 hypothetical protein CATRI_00105 [Corynebacterium atrinae]
MTIIDPFNIETELWYTISDYETAGKALAAHRADYTPEGLANAFTTRTQKTALKLTTIRATIDTYADALNNVATYEQAALLPPVTGAYSTADELAAARILARPGTWDHKRYIETITPKFGTTAATLLTEELTARGLSTDIVDAALSANERYKAAMDLHLQMTMGLNAVLRPLLKEAERAANAETWVSHHKYPGNSAVGLSDVHEDLTLHTSGKINARSLTNR